MTRDTREYTHTDGQMNAAPNWAHRLLDLSFEGWQIMPSGGIRMTQHAVPGQVFSAWSEYGKTSFTVDFRDGGEVWTVSVQPPQPEPVPPENMTVDEWLARKGKT